MKYKVEILYESFEKPDWVSILKQLKDKGKEGFPLVYGRHTDRDRGWTLFTPDDVDRAHERTIDRWRVVLHILEPESDLDPIHIKVKEGMRPLFLEFGTSVYVSLIGSSYSTTFEVGSQPGDVLHIEPYRP